MDRGLGRGWRVVVLVAFAVLVAGLVFAAGVQASGVSCDCTGSYSGTWTANVQYFNGASAGLTVNFAESLVPGAGGASAWDLTSASGTVSLANPNLNESCSTSLVPGLANIGDYGPQVDQGPAEITVDPWPPTWWSPAGPLVASPSTGEALCDDTSNETAYESQGWSFTGSECHTQITVPLNVTTTSPDNCDAMYSDSLDNKGTGTLTSTLTIAICPNPADNRLIADADAAAHDIFSDDFEGHTTIFGHGGRPTGDHLADYAVLAIKDTAAHVKQKFPSNTPGDRANRKRVMNKEASKLDDLLARVRQTALEKANAAEASFLARIVCPDAERKIRAIFNKLRSEIDGQYVADRRFIANEVIGATNLFCGCHLSRDDRTEP